MNTNIFVTILCTVLAEVKLVNKRYENKRMLSDMNDTDTKATFATCLGSVHAAVTQA